jgi:hypothetical protein
MTGESTNTARLELPRLAHRGLETQGSQPRLTRLGAIYFASKNGKILMSSSFVG